MHDATRRNIQLLMSERGITSERQLANACGVTQSTLHRFLHGQIDSLDLAHLMSIASYFSLTVSQLIGETAYAPDRKIRAVLLAMEHMPEYKKDVLVAASHTLAEQPKLRAENGK